MGLFSGISKALFGDPGKRIGRAGEQSLGYQQQGLDYLMDIDRPAVEARGAAIPLLQGFFTGDQGAQTDILERIKASPFYDEALGLAEEGALGRAGSMGLSRSGNVASDLYKEKQGVLQGFLNQQLGGLGSLANLGTQGANIASLFSQMGQTAGDVGVAQARADQSGAGNVLSGLLSLGGLFSDERLKKDVEFIGESKGHKVYRWKWNSIANELFDLYGDGEGVIAQEVEKYAPHLVDNSGFFKTVDYRGVANG